MTGRIWLLTQNRENSWRFLFFLFRQLSTPTVFQTQHFMDGIRCIFYLITKLLHSFKPLLWEETRFLDNSRYLSLERGGLPGMHFYFLHRRPKCPSRQIFLLSFPTFCFCMFYGAKIKSSPTSLGILQILEDLVKSDSWGITCSFISPTQALSLWGREQTGATHAEYCWLKRSFNVSSWAPLSQTTFYFYFYFWLAFMH